MKPDVEPHQIEAKGRIRPALSNAIGLIVREGLSVPDAAIRVKMQYESLRVALHKPHVVAYREAVKRAWLASATDKAWLTVVTLATDAASEDVRLKAAKVILDAAGELDHGDPGAVGPRTLVQIVVNHAPAGEQSPLKRLPGVIELESDGAKHPTFRRLDDQQ